MSESRKLESTFSRRKLVGGAGGAGAALLLGRFSDIATAGTSRMASGSSEPWATWVKSFETKPVKLGFSIWEAANPYYTPTKIGVSDAGAQLGITASWVGPAAPDIPTQISQFNDMVRTGYEAICVTPLAAGPWKKPIDAAVKKGVLVLTSNLDAPGSARELHFGASPYGSGYLQGQLIAKLVGKKGGKVAFTNCAPGNVGMASLGQGVKAALKKGGLQLVGEYPIDATDPAKNLATVENIVRANPDLVAFAPGCGPDTASAGKIRQRLGKKFVIVGHDLLPDTLSLVKSGQIDATIGQNPYLQGYLPIMYAYLRTVFNMPAMPLPDKVWNVGLEVVTKKNIDTVIKREKRFA